MDGLEMAIRGPVWRLMGRNRHSILFINISFFAVFLIDCRLNEYDRLFAFLTITYIWTFHKQFKCYLIISDNNYSILFLIHLWQKRVK